MERIGSKLKKQGVMALLSLVLIGAACDDRISSPEDKTIEVSMTIGLAEEVDGYNLSASTKTTSLKKGAFDVELTPVTETRATVAAKPNALYKLEIRQYDQDGNYLNGSNPADQIIGQRLTVNLTEATDCQLVFVAWGQNSSKSLGTLSLSKAQEVSIDASDINDIAIDNMNTMPYVLHLKHVKVTGSGSNGIITSPNGEDVRILLKRLATRLNISWNYNVSDYTLKQIILQSIPLNYKVIAAPDEKENNTYPTLLDQYTNIQLNNTEVEKGSYSRWIPANVRGFNTASNSPQYRIKANAPTGSVYVSFIAANTSDSKKKFDYRIYLGGKDHSDFNLYENTDYNYTINFNHTGIPTDDHRVTYIDPIPASGNNENFLPTANCFMVAPGAAFCFNPYKYYVNGIAGENTLLKKWCDDGNVKIKSVKVLWQTLENGDIGDPVLGTVNTATDHTNIVDFNNDENIETARIYCRVAPNTTGGNGVIAAYDGENGTGNILWSWHIWVTDYSPSSTGTETVLKENKQKHVYKLNGISQLPMMDRNLGAVAGYAIVPESELERSKANGMMYQWGRKDPFRSSYTNKKISEIVLPSEIKSPLEAILSCYRGDGITFAPLTFDFNNYVKYQEACQHPESMYKPTKGGAWTSPRDNDFYISWGMGGNKGLHDPCPSGWRVCKKENFYPLYSQANSSGTLFLIAGSNANNDGGFLISYNEDDRRQASYFRFPGYWMGNRFGQIGTFGYYWTSDNGKVGNANSCYPLRLRSGIITWTMAIGGVEQEALLIRCIQERE